LDHVKYKSIKVLSNLKNSYKGKVIEIITAMLLRINFAFELK